MKQNQQQTKGSTKKWWLLGLGVAGIGTLTYFGFQYYKNHNNGNTSNADQLPDTDIKTTKADNSSSVPKSKTKYKAPTLPPVATNASSEFPLKKGSKGEKVKALQNALIAKYGKSVLPRYGADGGFGTEMVNALKKLALPDSINESTYNVLVKGSAPDSSNNAKQFYNALVSKNFTKSVSLLKTLRNTADYSAVSKTFSQYRISSVRQTLVNALLNTFTTETQKQAIRMELLRIGLTYDGNKWALSGIDSQVLITRQATQVWKDSQTPISVPANMVLGRQLTTRQGYSLFENEGNQFLVNTQHVQFYN